MQVEYFIESSLEPAMEKKNGCFAGAIIVAKNETILQINFVEKHYFHNAQF